MDLSLLKTILTDKNNSSSAPIQDWASTRTSTMSSLLLSSSSPSSLSLSMALTTVLPFLQTSTLKQTTKSTVDPFTLTQSEYGTTLFDNDKPWTFLEIVVLVIFGTIIDLMTNIGNIMVFISFKMDRNLQTTSNYFLLSLACADLILGVVSIPLYSMYLILNYWPLGPVICDIWLTFDYLTSTSASLNMLVISLDRYFSVTRPLTYRAGRTKRRACLMIAAAWVLSIAIWVPAICTYPVLYGRTVQGTDKCEVEFFKANSYLTVVTALMSFYIPVTIMIILYWRIWRETKRRYRDLTTLFLVSHVGANPTRQSRQIGSAGRKNSRKMVDARSITSPLTRQLDISHTTNEGSKSPLQSCLVCKKDVPVKAEGFMNIKPQERSPQPSSLKSATVGRKGTNHHVKLQLPTADASTSTSLSVPNYDWPIFSPTVKRSPPPTSIDQNLDVEQKKIIAIIHHREIKKSNKSPSPVRIVDTSMQTSDKEQSDEIDSQLGTTALAGIGNTSLNKEGIDFNDEDKCFHLQKTSDVEKLLISGHIGTNLAQEQTVPDTKCRIADVHKAQSQMVKEINESHIVASSDVTSPKVCHKHAHYHRSRKACCSCCRCHHKAPTVCSSLERKNQYQSSFKDQSQDSSQTQPNFVHRYCIQFEQSESVIHSHHVARSRHQPGHDLGNKSTSRSIVCRHHIRIVSNLPSKHKQQKQYHSNKSMSFESSSAAVIMSKEKKREIVNYLARDGSGQAEGSPDHKATLPQVLEGESHEFLSASPTSSGAVVTSDMVSKSLTCSPINRGRIHPADEIRDNEQTISQIIHSYPSKESNQSKLEEKQEVNTDSIHQPKIPIVDRDHGNEKRKEFAKSSIIQKQKSFQAPKKKITLKDGIPSRLTPRQSSPDEYFLLGMSGFMFTQSDGVVQKGDARAWKTTKGFKNCLYTRRQMAEISDLTPILCEECDKRLANAHLKVLKDSSTSPVQFEGPLNEPISDTAGTLNLVKMDNEDLKRKFRNIPADVDNELKKQEHDVEKGIRDNLMEALLFNNVEDEFSDDDYVEDDDQIEDYSGPADDEDNGLESDVNEEYDYDDEDEEDKDRSTKIIFGASGTIAKLKYDVIETTSKAEQQSYQTGQESGKRTAGVSLTGARLVQRKRRSNVGNAKKSLRSRRLRSSTALGEKSTIIQSELERAVKKNDEHTVDYEQFDKTLENVLYKSRAALTESCSSQRTFDTSGSILAAGLSPQSDSNTTVKDLQPVDTSNLTSQNTSSSRTNSAKFFCESNYISKKKLLEQDEGKVQQQPPSCVSCIICSKQRGYQWTSTSSSTTTTTTSGSCSVCRPHSLGKYKFSCCSGKDSFGCSYSSCSTCFEREERDKKNAETCLDISRDTSLDTLIDPKKCAIVETRIPTSINSEVIYKEENSQVINNNSEKMARKSSMRPPTPIPNKTLTLEQITRRSLRESVTGITDEEYYASMREGFLFNNGREIEPDSVSEIVPIQRISIDLTESLVPNDLRTFYADRRQARESLASSSLEEDKVEQKKQAATGELASKSDSIEDPKPGSSYIPLKVLGPVIQQQPLPRKSIPRTRSKYDSRGGVYCGEEEIVDDTEIEVIQTPPLRRRENTMTKELPQPDLSYGLPFFPPPRISFDYVSESWFMRVLRLVMCRSAPKEPSNDGGSSVWSNQSREKCHVPPPWWRACHAQVDQSRNIPQSYLHLFKYRKHSKSGSELVSSRKARMSNGGRKLSVVRGLCGCGSKDSKLNILSKSKALLDKNQSDMSGNKANDVANNNNKFSPHHPLQPKSERKAAKTLTTLLLVFIATWLPYNILVLLKSLHGNDNLVPEKVWNLAYFLCYVNSTINPICYALCNKNFRRTYVRILKCKFSNDANKRCLVSAQVNTSLNKDGNKASTSTSGHKKQQHK